MVCCLGVGAVPRNLWAVDGVRLGASDWCEERVQEGRRERVRERKRKRGREETLLPGLCSQGRLLH